MGNTRRDTVVLTVQGKVRMDGTEVGDKIGKPLGKALPWHHHHLQAVGKGLQVQGFIQAGVCDWIHCATPFRKYVVCSCTRLAQATTCSLVTEAMASR